MRASILLLALCLTAATALRLNQQRIVGGSITTISQYPNMASLMFSRDGAFFFHACGGIILNNRSVLTAAHCPVGDLVSRWRIRVGSSLASSGGAVHNLASYIIHPEYNIGACLNNDIAIMRSASTIVFVNNAVQAATIAGPNYNLADNQVVWAAGWGAQYVNGPASENLRHVQIWTVNQATCAARYRSIGDIVTDNMLCSGWLDVGGRDQCQGDSGGPLYHNGVVVGVCSWGNECARPEFPGVNARVTRFSTWIQANA